MGEAVRSVARIDVRPWPYEPTIRHLVLLDLHMIPRPADIEQWVADVFDGESGVTAVRTGALFPDAADAFAAARFEPVDRLALLQRTLPRDRPMERVVSNVALRRLRRRDLEVAADLDRRAFPPSWRNGERSLDEICRATPRSHARIATLDGRTVGFAITGKAGPTGYLQRLAVGPETRRVGIGARLVDDAMRWLTRRGASSVLVNTGIDNDAGLALYASCGFSRRSDELVVMERRRT